MRLEFTKMHGTGNDYVYVNCFDAPLSDASRIARIVSDRHKGIGSDGLILVAPSDIADVKMIMYNADGSIGGMCGNGARCVAKFAYDNRLVRGKTEITMETGAGLKTVKLFLKDGRVNSVCVNMGAPRLKAAEVPMITDEESFISKKIEADGVEYTATCLSMGNPHCVIFTGDDIKKLPLSKIGPGLENNRVFPDRANIEFINAASPTELSMRVWERGSGETMACGTGACAAAVAAVLNGISKRGQDITVHLLGGDLVINWSEEGSVFMTGDAVKVFDGVIEID